MWLGEHRFSRHGLLSGIFSFLGQVAARTSHVRIGAAVIVLPLHNPILVAEEVAMLDVLSGGRLNLGIGSGYQRQEFEGLGIDMEESRERFVEAVEVMTRAWTEETLTYLTMASSPMWMIYGCCPSPCRSLIRRFSRRSAPALVRWTSRPSIKFRSSPVALQILWGKLPK